MASPAQQLLTLLPLLLGLAAAAAAAGADDDDCNRAGRCVGQIIATEDNILSAQQCLTRCKRAESCSWYNYDSVTRKCEHLSSCFRINDDLSANLITGSVSCEVIGPISPYFIGQESFNVVDILNPDASFNCQIPDYPVPLVFTGVGIFLHNPDRILICGGTFKNVEYKECYIFYDGKWELSDLRLPDNVTLAGGFSQCFIQQGTYWLLDTYTIYNLMKTVDIETWLPGPDVEFHQVSCTVQLDDTHILNAGGGGFANDAFIYDLTTSTKSPAGSLNDGHIYPMCSSDGKGGAYVLGGTSPSLEHYDPSTNKWTRLENVALAHNVRAYTAHFTLSVNNEPVFIPLEEDNIYYVFHTDSNYWSIHSLGLETKMEQLGIPVPPDSGLLDSCEIMDV